MSKNVRKKLKFLKLSQSHPGWKKVHSSSEEKITHKFKGLKKLIPSMGNFTSHHRWYNQTIENVDDHATKLMAALSEMRDEGTRCDVTLPNSKAVHKIVVSFNQTLLTIAESSSETIAVTIEEPIDDATLNQNSKENNCNESVPSEKILTSCVDTGLSVEALPDETEEANQNGLVSELKTDKDMLQLDEIFQEVLACPSDDKQVEQTNEKREDVIDVIANKCDEETQDNISHDGSLAATSNENLSQISPPLFSEIVVRLSPETASSPSSEDSEPFSSDIPPPLYSEISTNTASEVTVNVEVHENFHTDKYEVIANGDHKADRGTNDEGSFQIPIDEDVCSSSEKRKLDMEVPSEEFQTDKKETCNPRMGKDTNANEPSLQTSELFTDPISVLINFLYTSHIDITQKNVSGLKDLAVQCNMKDVISACDEFSKVLQMETNCLNSENEKEEVAAKFRYRYSDPSMPVKMLEHFENLRSENKLTDIKLKSKSGKIILDSHSLLLACGSPFFHSLISSHKADEVFDLAEIDEDVFESLIGFFYTGKVGVSLQTVSKLIQSADRMQLSDIIEGCAEYMESTTNVQNCIQHRSIAIDYKCDKLKAFTNEFIAVNFMAVTKTPEFMTLSTESLIELASHNDLVVSFPLSSGEMDVFNAVRRWVIHDEDNRLPHVPQVMAAVRFPLLNSKDLINNITTDLLIMSNQEMCNRITDVITSIPLYCFSEPVSMRGRECILTIGGSYPIEDDTCEERGYQAINYSTKFTIYDPSTATFNELTALPETRALHCVAACDQYVFVVGGYDPHSCITNSVYCFDLACGKWNALPTMKINRSCFSLHVTPGYLYAIGGLTPKGYTSSVERLDRKRKAWELSVPLPSTRYRHAGSVLNETIIISGGNDKDDAVLSLEPADTNWKKEPPLNIGRHSHVMQTVNQAVYALGGEEIPLSAECFKNGSWTLLPNPFVGPPTLYLPGCSVFENKIFMCGGWEKEDTIVFANRFYDTITCSWAETPRLPVPRGSAASCTIRIPKSYWKVKFVTPKQTLSNSTTK